MFERSVPDATRDVADRDELERGFRSLTPDQRALIVLHYYLGLPVSETADALGIPVGTVKSRLNRTTQALRARLESDARAADALLGERPACRAPTSIATSPPGWSPGHHSALPSTCSVPRCTGPHERGHALPGARPKGGLR